MSMHDGAGGKDKERRCGTSAWMFASGALAFLAGAGLCLLVFWGFFGSSVTRRQAHHELLQKEIQLKSRQKELLHHLRTLLQELQEQEKSGDGSFVWDESLFNCSQVEDDSDSEEDTQHRQRRAQPEATLRDLNRVLQDLLWVENLTRRSHPAPPRPHISDVKLELAGGERYAFATSATSLDGLWGALALARLLQRLSGWPLVLLTDYVQLPGGASLDGRLKGLNAYVVPMGGVQTPPELLTWRQSERRAAFWKLSAWRLTQFEKVIWLDSDSVITRNLDWLFERPGMWAQRDSHTCEPGQDKDEDAGASTEILSLSPSMKDYKGILEYAGNLDDPPRNTHELLSKYFSKVQGNDINLLSDVDAGRGKCLGKARSPYLNHDASEVRGFWDLPAYVHRSGGWLGHSSSEGVYRNVCFSIDIARQLYVVHGTTLNMCHFHPLGLYWRKHFCYAVDALAVDAWDVTALCNDECWLHGKKGSLPASSAKFCRPLNSTIGYADYWNQPIGWPLPEVKKPLD